MLRAGEAAGPEQGSREDREEDSLSRLALRERVRELHERQRLPQKQGDIDRFDVRGDRRDAQTEREDDEASREERDAAIPQAQPQEEGQGRRERADEGEEPT